MEMFPYIEFLWKEIEEDKDEAESGCVLCMQDAGDGGVDGRMLF